MTDIYIHEEQRKRFYEIYSLSCFICLLVLQLVRFCNDISNYELFLWEILIFPCSTKYFYNFSPKMFKFWLTAIIFKYWLNWNEIILHFVLAKADFIEIFLYTENAPKIDNKNMTKKLSRFHNSQTWYSSFLVFCSLFCSQLLFWKVCHKDKRVLTMS